MRPTVRMKRHRESVTRIVVGIILGSGALFAGLLLWSLWSRARDLLTPSAPPATNPALFRRSRSTAPTVRVADQAADGLVAR